MFARLPILYRAVLMAGLVGAPAAAAINIQPGLYEVRAKMTALTAPGLPPAQVKAILASPPETHRYCVTPQAIANGSWYQSGESSDGCARKDASGGGRINVSAQCGGQGSVQLTGTSSPTSFTATLASTNKSGKMTTLLSGRRIGACTADEDEE